MITPEEEKVELSIEKEDKDTIVDRRDGGWVDQPLTAKERIKIKQQTKLQEQRLIYRNNR